MMRNLLMNPGFPFVAGDQAIRSGWFGALVAPLLALVLVLVLAGCDADRPAGKAETEELTGVKEVAAREPGKLTGEELYLACLGCHSISEGEPHRVGPNLYGIMGQPAASRPGYTYSPALQESGLEWSEGTLTGWIVNAETMVPGTWMAYSNIVQSDELSRLVGYIMDASTPSAAAASATPSATTTETATAEGDQDEAGP